MNDSLFIFRLPCYDADETHAGRIIGSVGKAEEGICPGGFVIGSFLNDPADNVSIRYDIPLTLASLNECLEMLESNDTAYVFPEVSTTEEEHRRAVEFIASKLEDNEKCIAAKTIVRNGRIDFERSFVSLCNRYPDAFVFCFHTPRTGTWMGASPERLVSLNDGMLRTMALAGTRSAGSHGEWDHKNIEEHRIVAEFIGDCLKHHFPDSPMKRYPTATSWAGSVEHLRTDFTIAFHNDCASKQIIPLLADLSPTPALCGYPRQKAMAMIESTENFSRGYYGGWIGYMENLGCDIFVNLRSIWRQGDRWGMYVGGGILNDSRPAAEWWETEAKADSVISCLTQEPK